MSDRDFVARIDAISDPLEARKTLQEHEVYLSYDPYYREMRAALIRMINRVIATAEEKD